MTSIINIIMNQLVAAFSCKWSSTLIELLPPTATFRTYAHALGAFPTWGVMLPVVATALLPDYLFRMAEDNRHQLDKAPSSAAGLLQWFRKGRSHGEEEAVYTTSDQLC